MGFLDRFKKPAAARTEQDFIELAIAVARTRSEILEAEVSSDHELALRIVVQNTGEQTLFLNTPWNAAREAPRRDQEGIVGHFLDQLAVQLPMPADWETARAKVFLALRGQGYAAHSIGLTELVWQPVLDGLAHMLFVDLDSTVAAVPKDELDAWGVTIEEAWDTALRNTHRLAPKIDPPEDSSMLRIQAGQIDAASYLLAPGWLHGIANGRSVLAWASDRDWAMVLVGAGGADVESLARMAREEWEQAQSGVSPRLYTLDGDRIVPLTVSENDPAHGELTLARHLQQLSAYEVQKEALDRMHEQQGLDLWVGNLKVLERDGGYRSVAVWTHDCDSLLPAADSFYFIKPGEDGEVEEDFELPQAAVVEAAGLQPVKGLLPLRYRVETWPDDDVLSSLRQGG